MDRDQFAILASRLRPNLMRLLTKIGADEATAEDVVQDTLLKLWSLGSRLDDYASPDALATIIARNRLMDMKRADHTDATPDLMMNMMADRTMESDHFINRSDARRKIEMLLASLPDGQRVILTMRHIQGMEIADIARTLGCTEICVRSSLSRARHKLKSLTLKHPEL
ncbi:MAG: RNA polymerase sigma factor [Paramuribaculum sp.]|nr:RNA polymerase sigma factor [Paramuribaculum sp.]